MANQELEIRLREYKQGRISITANISLLNDLRRWATSHATENNDKVAIELCEVIAEYDKKEKRIEAHRIFKSIKSRKRQHPLTQREKRAIYGTKYHGWLKKLGWM